MKKATLILVVYFFIFSLKNIINAQDLVKLKSKLDSLKHNEAKFDSIIKQIRLDIKETENKIIMIEMKAQDEIGGYKTKVIDMTVMRKYPNLLDKIFCSIPNGSEVMVLGYTNEFWKINYNGFVGYIFKNHFKMNNHLEYIRNEGRKNDKKLKKKEEEKRRKEQMKKELAEKEALINKYTLKYGSTIAKKIVNGYIWLGMTKEMAIDSWGHPDDINKSVGSWGVHEQWIYGNQYLYFENGKLTSWQK